MVLGAIRSFMHRPSDPGAAPDEGWYRVSEASGGNLLDSSGKERTATLSGTYSRSEGALIIPSLSSSNQGGRSAAYHNLRTAPFAITAWARPYLRSDRNTSPTYGATPFPPCVCSLDRAGYGGWGLGIAFWSAAGGYAAGQCIWSNWVNITIPSQYGPDQWYFIAFSVGNTYKHRVWLNTQLIYTAPTWTGPSRPDLPSYIFVGRTNDDGGYYSRRNFLGQLDEVRIYKRELTEENIYGIWQQGRST